MRALHTLIPTLAAAAFAAGCVDDDSSLYVEAVLALTPPNCELQADPSAPQLLRGTLDVAFLRSYQGAVLVGNQLTPRGIKNQLRTETQGVELRGAEVRLTNAAGAVLEEFSVPAGGFVHSNSSESPGYGMALVTMIPTGRGQAFLSELNNDRNSVRTVVAAIRVFGTTLGGTELTSGEFTFPIDVCFGCLVDYPLEAVEDTGNGRICAGTAEGVSATQCIRGQDAVIDCRSCAATSDVCATVE
jgi:hypothetical protein